MGFVTGGNQLSLETWGDLQQYFWMVHHDRKQRSCFLWMLEMHDAHDACSEGSCLDWLATWGVGLLMDSLADEDWGLRIA